MLFVCHPKILLEALFSVSLNYFNSFNFNSILTFLEGILTPKRNWKPSAYAKFLGDK